MGHLIEPSVLASVAALHDRFRKATPFRHIIVDDFFVDGFARELLEQFPKAGEDISLNRFGAAGRKAAHRDLTTLGSAYRAANELFGSPAFLTWLGEATGIDGLLYDESNFGGGTHENFNGRDLRPHIDFNYHPATRFHRRINLIVYLNKGWRPEWGGSIALHSDPRDPLDSVTVYEPFFNRCIVFETSERSWHGFDRIDLPAEERHRTRKSLSIYLYTRERPENEAHGEHTTFYIARPLPSRFVAGLSLTDDDAKELGELMGQRDRMIELYQSEQSKHEADSAQAARLRILVTELRANSPIPIMGYVRPAGDVSGFFADCWCAAELRFAVRAERRVSSILVRARVPEGMPPGSKMSLSVNGIPCAGVEISPGFVELTGDAGIVPSETVEILIATSASANPKHLGLGADERDLGFFLECVVFEHAAGY